MPDTYIKLEGNDLGIIAGGTSGVAPGGVFLYKPINNLVPNPDMSQSELQACLPNGTPYVNIPYQAVRQVEVDNQPVWRNRDSFDLKLMGINPYDQVYWGKGNVAVEFRNDAQGVDELVAKILERDIGLRKTA